MDRREVVCIALGRCAPGEGEPEPFTSYGRRVGDTVYLWGDDSRESAGAQERPGTLFAVYGFLESVLGVKWVSPGDIGIVCRSRKTLEVPNKWSWRYSPPLMMGFIRTPPRRELRHAKEPGRNKYLPSAMRQTAEEAWRMEQDFRIWALRMKLWVKGRDWSFGHAFVNVAEFIGNVLHVVCQFARLAISIFEEQTLGVCYCVFPLLF